MIKQVFAQGDINYLLKLFDTYISIKDDSQILKVGCKIIQRTETLNNKEKLIDIMDTIYAIISNKRIIFRNLFDLEQVAKEKENFDNLKYLKEYKHHLSGTITEILKKIVKDIKKGIASLSNKNKKDDELFLQLNLADYLRYLCEVSTNKSEKENLIREAEMNYKNFFTLAATHKLFIVNQAYLTAIYHYAIFIYEVKSQAKQAIEYLKHKRKLIYNKLDEAYKSYVDSYPLIDMITDTLANWVSHQRDFDQYNSREKFFFDDEEMKLSMINNTRDINLHVNTD